jgi:Ca2+-binding RTX toxin-like protein
VVEAGNSPVEVTVSREGDSVYASNFNGGDISQYDVGDDGSLTAKAVASVMAGDQPSVIALTPPEVPEPPAEPPKCRGADATIVGTGDADTLTGTPATDVIVGFGARDTIRGKAGADVICGGGARDTLLGGKGADWVAGQGGSDMVKGNRGADAVLGDRRRGRSGAPGGPKWPFAGRDSLFGGSGRDRCDGGERRDSAAGCERERRIP